VAVVFEARKKILNDASAFVLWRVRHPPV